MYNCIGCKISIYIYVYQTANLNVYIKKNMIIKYYYFSHLPCKVVLKVLAKRYVLVGEKARKRCISESRPTLEFFLFSAIPEKVGLWCGADAVPF